MSPCEIIGMVFVLNGLVSCVSFSSKLILFYSFYRVTSLSTKLLRDTVNGMESNVSVVCVVSPLL